MRRKNYVRLNRGLFGRINYAYADSVDYKADRLFAERNIRVKWKKKQMRTPDGTLAVIFCSVPKKDHGAFLEAMEKLYDNMVVCGLQEKYDQVCDMFDYFERKEELRAEGEIV